MIPILYETSETSFSSNGIGRLTDAISCSVTEERNGIYELEMQYDIEGTHYKDLQLGRFIYATVSNGTKQIFQIYDITRPLNGKVMVYAEHISYRMRMIPVMPYSANGVSAALQGLKNNAVEDCPFSFWTDKTETSTFNLKHPDEMRGKLQGDQWSILQQYGGEFEYDNYTVKYWASRGSDKGVTLRYGKDITDLRQEENIQNTYTGIVPYWYGFVGEEQESVSLPEKALYSENVDNFPYRRTITVDFTDDFPEKPTVEELRARGQRYLRENDIGIPAVNISLSFVQLSQTLEYKDVKHIPSLYLCDIITVKFEKLGVSREAKITRTVWDVLNEKYISLGIGQIHHSLAVTIADQGQQIVNVKTNTIPSSTANALNSTQSLIEEQTQKITGQLGGYMIWHDSDGDGEPDELLIMNTSSIITATDVWRWNLAGLGHSSNGYEGPYTLAITADGKINADFIQTGTLNADLVNVINLIAQKVQSINSDETYKVDIDDGLVSVSNKQNGEWVRRVAIGKAGVINTDASFLLGNAPSSWDDATIESEGRLFIGLSPLQSFINATVRMYKWLWFIGPNADLLFSDGAKLKSKAPGWTNSGNGFVLAADGVEMAPLALKNLKPITSGANLNTYYTAGSYSIPTNTDAQGITNMPTPYAGRLIVESRTGGVDGSGTWRYMRQIFTPLASNGYHYERVGSTGSGTTYTWGQWVMVGGLEELTMSVKPLSSGSTDLFKAMLYSKLIVYGKPSSSSSILTCTVIPTALLTTTNKRFQINDETNYVSFDLKTIGDNRVTMTFGNASAGGSITNVYGEN